MSALVKELAEQRVSFLRHESQLNAIDEWRIKYRPIPSRNEAIRRLIERGLKAGIAGDAGIELVEDNGIGVTLRRAQSGDEGQQ